MEAATRNYTNSPSAALWQECDTDRPISAVGRPKRQTIIKNATTTALFEAGRTREGSYWVIN